jgi:subtilisin-like proprotein convertase family protein
MKPLISKYKPKKNHLIRFTMLLFVIAISFSGPFSQITQARGADPSDGFQFPWPIDFDWWLKREKPPEEYRADIDDIDASDTREASFGIAWGDPDGPHSVYDWPYEVVQMGHAIQSYQNYSSGTSSAYFHHGIDMIAPDGTPVYTRSGGQVVNIENYRPGNALYWEVAILDPEGYVWQYHHIDQPTIPQLIYDKFAEWQADPVNGGYVPPDTHIGDIIYWPVITFGYRFNHIHLNILADGDAYLNTMEFHTPLVDDQIPEIQEIGLLNGDTVLSGTSASGNYGLYVRARDLFMSPVYYLPPHKTEFAIDGGEWVTVWEFHDLPGGSDDQAYVNDFFVPNYTLGNYNDRDFYIDLGFTTSGQRAFPSEPGQHTIQVRVWDYNGNSDTDSFTWTVVSALPDNGCASGVGVTQSFTFTEDLWVTDVDLGLNISHTRRGQVKVTLQSPSDSTSTTIIDNSADNSDNYDVWLDDSSSNPLDDGNNDNVAEPYFDRTAGPSPNGALDSFNGKSALGEWTVFVCDNTSGTTGTVNLIELQIQGDPASNTPPVADAQTVNTPEDTPVSITLTGSDAEEDPLTYHVTGDPSHGSLSGSAPNLTYTPDANFFGADNFTFLVNDGEFDSAPATVSINVSAVNDAPTANPQSLSTLVDTPVEITLSGSDIEDDPLSFNITSAPEHGSLSGTPPLVTYTPVSGYVGSDSFGFTADDGDLASEEVQISLSVYPQGAFTVFWDDFETDQGWILNPNGTDTADSSGMFARADPNPVYYYGDKQLGTTASGAYALVTGPRSGRSSGSYDLDGISSIRSPLISLPGDKILTLSFQHYLAHYTNAGSDDYLRVSLIGATTALVFEELGSADNDNAVWESFSVDISAFAGQSVYLLIEAGDINVPSLVEAAIDDLLISAD